MLRSLPHRSFFREALASEGMELELSEEADMFNDARLRAFDVVRVRQYEWQRAERRTAGGAGALRGSRQWLSWGFTGHRARLRIFPGSSRRFGSERNLGENEGLLAYVVELVYTDHGGRGGEPALSARDGIQYDVDVR